METEQKGREIVFAEGFLSTYAVITVSEVEGPFTCDLLKKAAILTSLKHPLLRVSIQKIEQQHHFVPLDPKWIDNISNYVEIVEANSANQWKEITQECVIKNPMELEAPYWRIKLIKHEDKQMMLFIFSHAIGDGTSGTIVTNDLLYYCNNPHEDPVPLPLLPHYHDLIFPNGITPSDNEIIENGIKERQKQSNPTLNIAEDYPEGKPKKAIMMYSHGTVENYKKLHEKCREEHVTIGNVLLAAMYFEGAHKVPLKNSDVSLSVDVDVNFRSRFDPPLGPVNVGLLIGVMKLPPKEIKITPMTHQTKFWELAKELNTWINHLLKIKQAMYRTVIKTEMRKRDLFVPSTTRVRNGDMSLSNVGRYPFPHEHGPFKIKSIYTASSVDSGAWYFTLFCHAVDYLCYSWEYDESIMKEENALDWFTNITNLIERAHQLDNSFTIDQYIQEFKSK